MRVLVAMSGGVDSSVAAALLQAEGHDVVGATMKLWGGPSDSGCCSVADVDDARRVAQQLGIDHHVFNFSEEFDARVVGPYADEHASGRTPNPCIECNRHIKFDRFLDRARRLGFDAVATGHHARVTGGGNQPWALRRGQDAAKDQSYVLYMLGQDQLSCLLLPVGTRTKAQVREIAAGLGLRTATKPDSQDVCFISRTGGRQAFLEDRIQLSPGEVYDSGQRVGRVAAVQLVTVGQRRGLSHLTGTSRRYVVGVDTGEGRVELGPLSALMVDHIPVTAWCWVDRPPDLGEALEVQTSAHGQPVPARLERDGRGVAVESPVRRVAPGQSVVLYRGDAVVGGGLVD